MQRFNQIFNKPNEMEEKPQADLSAFNKFSQANKQNIGPNTSLGVTDTFNDAYQGTQDIRQKAIEKIAEQTDLGKDIPGVGVNEDYRNIAKTGLDMVIPDVTDLIPGGKVGKTANAMFPILGMAAKEGKLLNFAKKGEQTAEELMQGIRKADSADLKLGSNLINNPVFATEAEKAAQSFGKVIGGGPSSNDIMSALQQNPKFLDLKAKKSTMAPSAYDNQKQALINEIRKSKGGM